MASELIPHVVEDCLHGLLKLYSDGSIVRATDPTQMTQIFGPTIPDDGSAVWKDCVLDPNRNSHARLYKPKNSTGQKLPILLYFHPGGFCVGSRDFFMFHNTCVSLCSGLDVLVVSPDYRLAPENRLPASVEDGRAALRWLQNQASDGDEWFKEHADFDRVFLSGDSAGATICHHMAVEFEEGSPDLAPVRIRGHVFFSPFFGGVVKMKSEKEKSLSTFWTQEVFDRFLRIALPHGANADYPLVNPFGPESPDLKDISLDPIMVITGADEVLKDRTENYAMRLKKLNKNIKYVELEGTNHAFLFSDPFGELAKKVIGIVKEFIYENSGNV